MTSHKKTLRTAYCAVILIGVLICLHGAAGSAEQGRPMHHLFPSLESRPHALTETACFMVAFHHAKSSVRNRVRHFFGVHEMPADHDNEPEAKCGMVLDRHASVAAINPKETQKLPDVIDAVREKPIVFIGERHANYEDHKVELDVIQGLYNNERKIAIGMEMFQRPFQASIDAYLAGSITERQFLKKTEYFKRWVLDYNYYREIIEYAKAKGIPILALNQRSEIITKVAAAGLDSLSADDRSEIPQDMETSDQSYRKRLEEVYEHHPHISTFEHFYQSQILWDETMAHTAAHFLKENPRYQIVVLAGVEHIMKSSGIPSRLKRLSGKDYVTLINGVFDQDIGTYVLITRPIEPPLSPKLGIIAREVDGKVVVESFSRDSAALQAGLEEGDIIASIDGWMIQDLSDIKIALFDKKPGQNVRISIVRKRFFLGTRRLDLSLHF